MSSRNKILEIILRPVINMITKVDKKIYKIDKPIGQIGGLYDIYRVVGEGGCGIVYLAFSHRAASFVALKTFRDDYLLDVQTRERFRKEGEIWIKLGQHPHIVKASFVAEIDGRLFIEMEYIHGISGLRSLDDYLKHNPPDFSRCLKYSIQFCYGMEYAYSRGVRAHRDIKPSNIMIQNGLRVKISDFGLAGFVGSSETASRENAKREISSMQTIMGTGFGTPVYMSPEQFENAASCDERSDIYSFGIVLYQMVSGGNLPFYTEDRSQLWQIMKYFHNESPVPTVNSPIFPLIKRCLEKEPDKRCRSFAELRSGLEGFIKDKRGKAIIEPRIEKMTRPDWNDKGLSLANVGKYQEAIDCFNQAIEMEPDDSEAWYHKGTLLIKLQQHQEAINAYQTFIKFASSGDAELVTKVKKIIRELELAL